MEGIISRWLEKKNFTPALILGFDIPFSPHRDRLFRRRNVEDSLERFYRQSCYDFLKTYFEYVVRGRKNVQSPY